MGEIKYQSTESEFPALYLELAEELADMFSIERAKMIDEIEDNEDWAEYPFDVYHSSKD